MLRTAAQWVNDEQRERLTDDALIGFPGDKKIQQTIRERDHKRRRSPPGHQIIDNDDDPSEKNDHMENSDEEDVNDIDDDDNRHHDSEGDADDSYTDDSDPSSSDNDSHSSAKPSSMYHIIKSRPIGAPRKPKKKRETGNGLCELCGESTRGGYGSGRFCGPKCARTFSISLRYQRKQQKILAGGK